MSIDEKRPEVIALLLAGTTISEINRITGVSKSSISRIKDKMIDGKYGTAILDLRNNLSEYIAQSLKKHLVPTKSVWSFLHFCN